MSPRVRKLLLTTHVTMSVGWLGSVAAFLALALTALKSDDDTIVRGAYVSMDVIAWLIILPACFASLVTGVTQSLAGEWGLFRHYWVVFKLIITVAATAILCIHMQPISEVARAAATMTPWTTEMHDTRVQLVVDSAAAIVALLVTTALSVVKPRGLTAYGARKQQSLWSPPD